MTSIKKKIKTQENIKGHNRKERKRQKKKEKRNTPTI